MILAPSFGIWNVHLVTQHIPYHSRFDALRQGFDNIQPAQRGQTLIP